MTTQVDGNQKKVLGLQDIVAAQDIKVQEIEVPEWGGVVLMRPMSGIERDEFELWVTARSGTPGKIDLRGLKLKLLTLTIVDGSGKPVFSNEDMEELGKKSAVVIERLFQKAQNVNGMGEEAVKVLTKN